MKTKKKLYIYIYISDNRRGTIRESEGDQGEKEVSK
jgi:hypothetical protein